MTAPGSPPTKPTHITDMTKCDKDWFAHRDQAIAVGRRVHRATLDVRPMSAYQCKHCRYPDGRKAWHWGHRRQSSRNKQW